MSIRVGASVAVLALATAGLSWSRPVFGQEQPSPEQAFHAQVDLVSTYFTVRDEKKRLVTDLPENGFTVSEEGQPQNIKFFAHHGQVKRIPL